MAEELILLVDRRTMTEQKMKHIGQKWRYNIDNPNGKTNVTICFFIFE